jgi:hypothetical protein
MGFMGLFGPDIRSMERGKDVESLIDCLKNDNNNIRSKSCDSRGNVGDKRAI